MLRLSIYENMKINVTTFNVPYYSELWRKIVTFKGLLQGLFKKRSQIESAGELNEISSHYKPNSNYM